MKASNGRAANPAQYLERLRQRTGIQHSRRVRDELGWRWKPSAMLWTLRRSWRVCAADDRNEPITGRTTQDAG